MVLCDTCKHLGNMAIRPCEDCLQGDRYERKPTTNADRIRAMTDEELAEFITGADSGFGERPGMCDVCNTVTVQHCEECWLGWLKQEVECDG